MQTVEIASYKDLKVSDEIRIFYYRGNINNKTYEVRAIVDEDKIVLRRKKKGQAYWSYFVEDQYWIDVTLKNITVYRRPTK